MTATPIDDGIIHEPKLPAAYFTSYCRLKSRAWDGQATGELRLSLDALMDLLQLRRSKTFEHLRWLKAFDVIAWATNGDQVYTIRFPDLPPGRLAGLGVTPREIRTEQVPLPGLASPRIHESGNPGIPDSVVVVEDINNQDININTQQHTQSTSPTSGTSPEIDSGAARITRLLVAAGIWREAALDLGQALADFEAVGQGDPLYSETHVGVRDVLGWIAYCRDPRQTRIYKAEGLIASNLRHARLAPVDYRPPLLCRRCRRLASQCACDGATSDPYLPDEYDRLAFDLDTPDSTGPGRWGICAECHALDCQCAPAPELEPAPAEPVNPLDAHWAHMLQDVAVISGKQIAEPLLRCRLLAMNAGEYVIGVPHESALPWYQGRMTEQLQSLIARVDERTVAVRFVTTTEGTHTA